MSGAVVFSKGETMNLEGNQVDVLRDVFGPPPYRQGDFLVNGALPTAGATAVSRLIADEAKKRIARAA